MKLIDLPKFFREEEPEHIRFTFDEKITMDVSKYPKGLLVHIVAKELKPFIENLQRFDDGDFLEAFKIKDFNEEEATIEECCRSHVYALLKMLSNKIELYNPDLITIKEIK